jgi:hypothetical protein
MHGGYREFSVEARYNAIKRFLNEKLEQIERENKFKYFLHLDTCCKSQDNFSVISLVIYQIPYI